MLLSAEHISKNYGIKQLFLDASLFLSEKEHIGIIGINGTGKSTLLKILAGLEEADSGTITQSPNVKTVYLPQNPEIDRSLSVMEHMFDGATKAFYNENEYKAAAMLNKLGITDYSAKISTLSGGQRKRVCLAKALIQPADILILDEPTNHLDAETIEWLERYLQGFGGGLIMVTHDRWFLERVATKITELFHSKLYSYEANYSKYLALKAEREEMAQASERKRQTLIKREYQWIMRGARARSTKSKGRIERYENLLDESAPQTDDSVAISAPSSRLGKKIIELDNVSKSYDGKKIIDGFSYMLSRDERVGIVGKNGAGKSTLLNIISGDLQPDSGQQDSGSTVKTGYFRQECGDLPQTQRVYDFITDIASEIKTDDGTFTASQMLERFLFTPEMQYMQISRLSGGEKRRLYLLSILMTAPNVLLLDEPTNDLDIETLTILEDYLDAFQGAVIAVSHDRFFLDKTVQQIFEVCENGMVIGYTGNYSDYVEKRILPQKELAAKAPKVARVTEKPKQLKFTYNEQREFETIDCDIAALEENLSSCQQKIEEFADNYEQLQPLLQQKNELDAALEAKTERWVYLNELAEKIEEQKKKQ